MPQATIFKNTLKKLSQINQQHSRLLDFFSKQESLIAGSYAETSIPCGKPTCHCHRHGGHFATRLARWVNGKLRTQIIRIDDREWVAKASALYKAHKTAIKDIQKLHAREIEVLKQVIKLKIIDYE